MFEAITIIVLVLSFPVALLAVLMGLDRFEASFVQPDERAAAVAELIASAREPEEVEHATVQMLAHALPDDRVGAGRY